MLTMTLPVTQHVPTSTVAYPQNFLQPMIPAQIHQMKPAEDFKKIGLKDGQIVMSQKPKNTAFNALDALIQQR